MTQRKRTVWPLLLALLGLALLATGLGFGAYQRAIAAPGAAPLPSSLASLRQVEKLTGHAAADNITHLHRQRFPLSGAAVGSYGDGRHSATLWVSRSPLALMAGRLERAMEQAIGAGNSPFVPEETRRADGRPVLVLTGLGQQHFTFRSGKLVIWLAADAPLAEAALAETLAFYP